MQQEWLEKLRRIPADALPAHFLDPITCEAMQDPVLLPSGNAVDRTTSCALAPPPLHNPQSDLST